MARPARRPTDHTSRPRRSPWRRCRSSSSAIGLVLLFATNVVTSSRRSRSSPPGEHAWNAPDVLILPVATLIIVVFPYIFRIMRASMIEVLESDYVEMARLKGLPNRRSF